MALFDFARRRWSLWLADRGYRAIEEEEPDRALAIARRLERLRYSAAFEIAALALAQKGELPAAVDTLKRGVALAPESWINWQLLGNYLSDLERYEDAAAAYDRALQCPQAQRSSVRVNQSILALRRGRYSEVLDFAAEVTAPEQRSHVLSSRAAALCQLGRVDEAVQETADALQSEETRSSEQAGYIAAAHAEARLQRGDAGHEVRAFALGALDDYARTSDGLLSVVRQIDAASAEAAALHRLLLNARIPASSPLRSQAVGFYAHYQVIAESLEEALRYAAAMETAVSTEDLSVAEHDVISEKPAQLKGVYSRSGRIYYARED